jgi:hypothetical protein
MISDSLGQISLPQMLERLRASVKRGERRAMVGDRCSKCLVIRTVMPLIPK